jgi:hypothetical protein
MVGRKRAKTAVITLRRIISNDNFYRRRKAMVKTGGNNTAFIIDGCKNRWFRSLTMAIAAACITGLPVVAIGITTAAVQVTYYVSPSGSDTNVGTLDAPFLTITKARDIVQTINKNMTGDIVVYLRGGTYTIDSTIRFGTACSGTNGYTVKFMNYSSETPVISGGQVITGWTLSDAAKNIYQATGVSFDFRQLYVNGVKAVRARTPNVLPGNKPNFWKLTGVDGNAKNVQVESAKVSNWNNFKRVEMQLILCWGDNTLRLDSYSVSGSTAYLKIQSPEQDIIFQRPNPGFGFCGQRRYFLENAYEFLDTAGEWYLNQSTKTLYYKPRAGETMATATVIAPKVDTLLSIRGASTADQAHNITFSGIAFLYANYLRPSNYGFLDAQTGQYNVAAYSNNQQYVGRPAAGVYVACANHIRFERNIFAHIGATGLDFNYGTHDDMIVGNVFTDIAGNGVSIAKFTKDTTAEYHVAYTPSDTNERCVRDTIRNNYVYNVTTEMFGGCGIACGYPRMVNIVHNEVCYTSYTAISVGYGWTSTVNPMSNNHIDSNDVHHYALLLGDAGGIYTLSNQQPNSTMFYNYLHDYFPVAWADNGINGIYLDEQTSGYSVVGNVFINAVGDQKVHRNQAPNNTESNNDGTSATTVANAGIEAAYRDIKNFIIPTTGIVPAPRLMQKTTAARSGSASSYRVYSLSGRYLGTVGLLSQKMTKSLYAGGICLIRPGNTPVGKYAGAVRRVIIVK